MHDNKYRCLDNVKGKHEQIDFSLQNEFRTSDRKEEAEQVMQLQNKRFKKIYSGK